MFKTEVEHQFFLLFLLVVTYTQTKCHNIISKIRSCPSLSLSVINMLIYFECIECPLIG